MELVRSAYAFSEQAHREQRRKSGDPYFVHPCAVAVILADLMLDATTIAAGLLHDCVEDVEEITSQTIRETFGQDVELLVDGVTKLSKLNFSSREEQQAESLRKMFLAMAKDIRVVLIKLADRLHNMRTLKYQKPERQVPIARETLDIYAPLAHRLGVYTIKWELEDLSLRYIDPDGYYDLVAKVGMRREEREKLIASVTQQLQDSLRKTGIKAEIEGRPKHFYSIYKKMKSQNKTFDQINDLIAIRVLVNTQQDCYYVLGVVHTLWPQVPGRFKDYISLPKANMYQSLHTTVVNQGSPFEVQIRTFEMHRTAEYGIAAHWRYKEGKQIDELDTKLSWLRRILDWQSEARDSSDFGELLKFDLFADEVFVFTPKGDVVSLPRGATPLDFAYRIHSAVGNRCIGAKVNGRIVPLSSQLETGDFVEVMTSQASHGPSRDWLNIVKTSEAKAKIRAWLKKEEREENIVKGKEMLAAEAKKQGYTMSQLTKNDILEPVFKRYSLSSLDDLYATIGFGGLSTLQLLNRLAEEYKKHYKPEPAPLPPPEKQEEAKKQVASSSSNGVIVKGESGMLVRFARCCNPLPGDDIVGYITRGRGVSVHRADCINLKDSGVEPERMIEVEWESSGAGSYEADIQMLCYDHAGLFAEISLMFAAQDVPVTAVTAHTVKNKQGLCTMSMTIVIKTTQQLDKLLKDLQKRPDVIEVFRVAR
ncbi:MAG TPA: bifunctional (p)ppGpp synthetase/guanosine-3',5'-bis(diphosphate) 3'-pyrophosphohydrolase [Candidatus Pullichristensenella stercorigallinarum]|uniref:GTP diphosphokinase n=1 Tax=Candidatus Pullichristensenella stercorigallinarum TaxID=2840909 RepID=A0A9D0ZMV3_9FIRM|nr:bifunctional (p)ppGpp synthetase/guanosine-3',5'-bis(diphosphate) 3'-pyrophosphohydrolase [Candidatus Pullichristensenella stercorigallinarum]